MRRAAVLAVLIVMLSACTQTVAGQANAPADLKWQRNITTAVAKLGGTLGTVGSALDAQDYGAVSRACTKLQNEFDQLSQQLPTPNQDVNSALQDGIDNWRTFARVCRTMTPGTASASFDQLQASMDRGDASMRKALKLMGIDIDADPGH
ncbi:hypothetical protein [Mycobacterium sp. OTB74]|uniref:hypothetical protein n=1 Tax=Mycobacterium sp. OTB74 TaxID=1853452 RepID=UPI0024733ED0|nr:hypothetical protein [Mycobacterium sp. OTB74]